MKNRVLFNIILKNWCFFMEVKKTSLLDLLSICLIFDTE
uniref:Uncharacterized protein n=1 Tax=Manihot esculenta TaxID=3983 RepID=A0A2C9UXH8_MANES